MGDMNLNLRGSDGFPEKQQPPEDISPKDTLMGITLKGWAISAVSLITVLTAMGTGLVTVIGKYENLSSELGSHKKNDLALVDQNTQLSSELQTVRNATDVKISEAVKHQRLRDRFESVPIENDPEVVTAEYYPSDGCIHVSRKQPTAAGQKGAKNAPILYGQNVQDIWIPDPSGGVNSKLGISSLLARPNLDIRPVGIVNANGRASAVHKNATKPGNRETDRKSVPMLKRAGMFQGSCLNPHPGNFQTSSLQINACEVQIWRRFADSCTHYQLYNACTGQWAPGINWTFCNVQHRW